MTHEQPTSEELLDGVVAQEPAQDAPAPAEPAEAEPAEAEAAEGEAAEAVVAEAEPDYKDRYVRAVADLDNVRKRARRDVALAQERGVARLAKEMLPALDNLDRAIAAAEAQETDAEHHLTKGIRLVQQELSGALTRAGIVMEFPKGLPFDPHRHEAVAQQPVEGTPPGVVVEVYSPGYTHGDAVLRAAKVVVSG